MISASDHKDTIKVFEFKFNISKKKKKKLLIDLIQESEGIDVNVGSP